MPNFYFLWSLGCILAVGAHVEQSVPFSVLEHRCDPLGVPSSCSEIWSHLGPLQDACWPVALSCRMIEASALTHTQCSPLCPLLPSTVASSHSSLWHCQQSPWIPMPELLLCTESQLRERVLLATSFVAISLFTLSVAAILTSHPSWVERIHFPLLVFLDLPCSNVWIATHWAALSWLLIILPSSWESQSETSNELFYSFLTELVKPLCTVSYACITSQCRLLTISSTVQPWALKCLLLDHAAKPVSNEPLCHIQMLKLEVHGALCYTSKSL